MTIYITISTTYQMDIDAEDHELSDSASDQSIRSERSHHHPTNGYEICALKNCVYHKKQIQ
jgi:hypothetical protein